MTSDAPHPVPSTFLHAVAGLRAGVEVPLIDHLALRATGDMLFTLRPSVALIYGARAWETPLVSASFGLGAVASNGLFDRVVMASPFISWAKQEACPIAEDQRKREVATPGLRCG